MTFAEWYENYDDTTPYDKGMEDAFNAGKTSMHEDVQGLVDKLTKWKGYDKQNIKNKKFFAGRQNAFSICIDELATFLQKGKGT